MQDTTPPVVSVTPSPATLSPGDDDLVPIDLHLTATDNCALAGPPSCTVTSSEAPRPKGHGREQTDIVWVGGKLFLRPERARPPVTYTIACTATDTSGNQGFATALVRVLSSANEDRKSDEWDEGTHTVSSGKGCVADKKIESGEQSAPFTFRHTFTEAGTVPYLCDYMQHCAKGQKGVVVVTAP